MAFTGVSSRFSIASFFALGKWTLSFIMLHLLSWLHLVIYKGKKSSLIPHSFCIHTPSFFYTEKPFVLNKMASPSSLGSNSPKNEGNGGFLWEEHQHCVKSEGYSSPSLTKGFSMYVTCLLYFLCFAFTFL